MQNQIKCVLCSGISNLMKCLVKFLNWANELLRILREFTIHPILYPYIEREMSQRDLKVWILSNVVDYNLTHTKLTLFLKDLYQLELNGLSLNENRFLGTKYIWSGSRPKNLLITTHHFLHKSKDIKSHPKSHWEE